ncbi:hypothetical protein AB0H24_31710 [Streptomyces globisporus]|uniref:hypothetical protein n=1 Tax=Streptomyces TaxID=1883 RepID=UPI0011614639|nr:hypothetical protein [Streptomyces sp. TSRI0445]
MTARSSTPSSSHAVATTRRTADSSWPDPCTAPVVLLLSVTGTPPHSKTAASLSDALRDHTTT